MTDRITYKKAPPEHFTKQPDGLPFALFCDPARNGTYGTDCESKKRMGHLGDFETQEAAQEVGIPHPHDVTIVEFPLPE